jgi:hypothetical protein
MKKAMLIFLVIFTLSCEKENKTRIPVFAGVINEGMYYTTLDPVLSINYVEISCGYGIGKDSIDLLNDGIYDIRLIAKFLLDYQVFLDCCGNADCIPNGVRYRISSLNNINIATYNVSWWDNLYFTYADTLNSGYRIDTLKNWQSSVDLWCCDYSPYVGSWYFIKNDKYLAIRMGDSTDYKYGWIKIGTNSDHNLVSKEYAVEE